MTHDVKKFPKLRSIMWSAFHDNLMLRSTVYFRVSRYLRTKKPQIDDLKENYFKEIIRIFNAIFFKKERYSFHELYALSLQEWWYPTQLSIKKFDRFDRRTYDRWNSTDTSVFFSFSTLFLTISLFSISYAYSMGLRDYYKNIQAEQEKYFYTQEGADVGHYASQLLYADRRDFVINELKYNGLMRLHDEITSRAGRLIDGYYSVLDDARRERELERFEAPTTLIYERAELANIANVMKGKARDYELADDIIIRHVQQLWFDAAQLFVINNDVSHNPYLHSQDARQEHADVGHFLMSHIDKISQSATFPEFEGEPQLSYILDDGVIKLKPVEGEHGVVMERAFSQDQEERHAKTSYLGTQGPTKYLSLSEAISYIDHTDECALAKLSRLETNLQMFLQLLDAISSIQEELLEKETEDFRILEIPSSQEISDMQLSGTFDQWLKDWHKKQRQLLPHTHMPPQFAELKAKQILRETGNKHAAISWLYYYNRYVKPGLLQSPEDEYGTIKEQFGLKQSDMQSDDQLLYQINNIESNVDKAMKLFRPHVNLLLRNINRLVQLRPRVYKEVKDQMVSKFIGLVDLDPDITGLDSEYTRGDFMRVHRAHQRINQFSGFFLGGSIDELAYEQQVPLMMLEEIRFREATRGNVAGGTRSAALRSLAPKPSELAGMEDAEAAISHLYGDEEQAREERSQHIAYGIRRAIVYDHPIWNIQFTPENWSTLYEPMLYGWDVDELKRRRKLYLQWFSGHLPSQISTDPSPRADEWDYQAVTPFDENSYYDAWTDIYQLIARTKHRVNSNYVPKEVVAALPWQNIFVMEKQTDRIDEVSLVSMARAIPETYRYKYDTYQLRTYGTDQEFWYNRKVFYQRIDRYFKYFKFYLNRQWSTDILDTNERWRKFKRFISNETKSPSFYEDYFLSHGFYHFLTKDPVYAKYGNDFFFRYFIDAPKFDRRPIALIDRHRYDKDGEDIYFDALYNSRVLNNPWPLHVEHMAWSLKPWYDFVNAQFAIYRYHILSDGDHPPEFPQLYIQDVEDVERFVVPDQNYGYDAVWTWGKDIFDPTYKKQSHRHQALFDKYLPNESMIHPRTTFLDFHESYLP